jgi:predicted peroxiredoxin
MDVDILMFVDTKGARMFRKKQVKTVCDNLCRAQALRDEALFKAAQQGPRL